MSNSYQDVQVTFDGPVATVEMCKPPHNFFTIPLIRALADAFEDLEADRRCHAIVLAAQGTSFCAGADFSNREATPPQRSPRALNPIYDEAIRMFACRKPVVAAVQGPAIGGGLGVALVADFRVTCPEAKFSANFNRLGFHPGFGLTATLPRLVGVQKAAMLFYTGRRINGTEAAAMGLADLLVPQDQVRMEAQKLAREIAISARATRCARAWSSRSVWRWHAKASSRTGSSRPKTSRKAWLRWRRAASPPSRASDRHHVPA